MVYLITPECVCSAHDLSKSYTLSTTKHFYQNHTSLMSLSSGSGTPLSSKRPAEYESSTGNDAKKVKAESSENPLDDAHLSGLFDPLPFETKEGAMDSAFGNADEKFELPDFLADKLDDVTPHPSNGSTLIANSKSPPATSVGAGPPTDSKLGASSASHALGGPVTTSILGAYPQKTNPPSNYGQPQLSSGPPIQRVNSSNYLPQSQIPGASSQMALGGSPLYHSTSNLNMTSSYPYQKTTSGPVYPNAHRPPSNLDAMGQTYKSSIRFDPKKTYPAPAGMSMGGSNVPGYPVPGGAHKDKPADPSKLNDALAAAGVDIQREEELLSTQNNRAALNLHQQQLANRQRQNFGPLSSFLHPYHVALFMNRTARENGVAQNFMIDPEMLDFMSAACKEWISNIVTKTIALARHRRRGIPAFNNKNAPAGKQKTIPPLQRSEVSKELRNLALKQKEQEERRVAKRLALGLEKSDEVAPETGNKAGAEETLHRAANATAAMMTMNPSRKKYSWMTSGASDGSDVGKASPAKDSSSKQSTLISTRGDNGLRYREIRTGNMVTTKDLLGVLEEERMATSKALIKGYAKLKD